MSTNTKINFGSDAFKKYLANTGWLFFERVFRLAINFAIGIYIVRYLGPNDFGSLSYAVSFVGLFSTLAALGLDNIVVRELVQSPDKRDELLGSVFILRLLGAVLLMLILVFSVIVLNEDSVTTAMILIIGTASIFQIFGTIDFYFQAKVLSKFSVYVQFTSLVIASAIKIFLILNNYSLIAFAIIITIESFLLATGFILIYKKNKLKITSWRFKKSLAMNLLRDSWPLILSGLVIAVYMKIDQVMIKNMMNETEVGYYAAAVRLSEAWYFIPMAVTNSLFPAIVNAKKMSEELYHSRLQKLYDILAWSSIAIAIPVTFFSVEIIKILFGANFLNSAPVLTIYIWAGVPTFLGVASSQFLITENLTKLSFYRTLIGMIMNIILNLILIPIYGIVGAALATLVSYTIATLAIGIDKPARIQITMMLKAIFFLDFRKAVKSK